METLIKDGLNEKVSRAVTKFNKETRDKLLLTQQTDLIRKEQLRKSSFARSCVNRYVNILNISDKQLGELISSLKEADVLKLDNQFTELMQKKVSQSNVIHHCALWGISIFEAIWGFVSVLTGIDLLGAFFVLSLLPTVPSFILIIDVLHQNSYKGSCKIPYNPREHLALRRYLKEKYGPEYFPYQEFKEKLGLIEK